MFQLFLTLAPKKWNLVAFFRAFILLWAVGVHAIAFSEECPRPSTTGDLQPTKAEILYVNSQDGMVTLKHEAVPFLELPSNTGSYQIADDALLSYLKVGEKGWVSFIRRKTHLAIVEWQADACFKTPAKGP